MTWVILPVDESIVPADPHTRFRVMVNEPHTLIGVLTALVTDGEISGYTLYPTSVCVDPPAGRPLNGLLVYQRLRA